MKKNTGKRSLCFLLIFTMFCLQGMAAEVEKPVFEVTTRNIVISGKLTEAKPYANVTLEVYRPDFSPGSIDPSSPDFVQQMKEALFYLEQKNADREGNFCFTLDMTDSAVGEYPVRISADGAAAPYETTVFYATLEHKTEFLKNIAEAQTAGEVQQLLSLTDENCTVAKLFQLTDPLYFSADPVKTAELFFQLNQKNPIHTEDPAEFTERLLLCSVLQNLNQGTVSDLMQYQALFEPKESFVTTYKTKLTAQTRSSFTALFQGKDLQSAKDLQQVFQETVFLSLVNHIQNWSDILYAIEHHGEDMALDMAAYQRYSKKDTLAVELAKKSPFSSVSDFGEALSKLASKPVPPPTPRPSGGGGGGGGIVSSGGQTLPPIPSDTFSPQPTAQPSAPLFDDLASVPWAKESIEALAEKGVLSGTGPKTFEPEREILREEFVKMLVSAFDIETADATSSFTDVPAGSWFSPYAAAAQEAGLIQGYPDGRLGAGERLTREEMMTLAYRTANYKGISLPDKAEELFSDDNEIAGFAKEAVYAMKNAGIVSGMEDGSFAPKQPCTRAQAAKILYGLITLGGGQ